MNNFNYAIRYLLKARRNNITRVISLALGLSIGLVIFSFVNFQLTFNRDFPDKEQIYQLFTWYNAPGLYGSSNLITAPIAPAMAEEFPEIEAATRFLRTTTTCSYNDNSFRLNSIAADTSFFDILNFGIIEGNPKEIFLNPYHVMISQSAAKLLFGEKDPIGKILTLDKDKKEVIVSGVFKDPPINNNLGELEIILSLLRYNPGSNFDGSDQYPTYIKLKPGTSIASVEGQLPEFWKRHNYTAELEQYKQSFYFIPLTKSYTEGSDIADISYMLSAIASLILFVSCMNYVLLSISTMITRSKTIGMLKCSGARKRDVFNLFLWETLFIILIALILAGCIIITIQPFIEDIIGYKIGDIFALKKIYIPLCVILGVFLTGALIPAKLFTSIPVSAAFTGTSDSKRIWKKILLFLQLTSATIVVILMSVITLQYHKIKSDNFGYQHNKVLHISLNEKKENYNTLLQELRKLPEVETAALASKTPIYGYSGTPLQDIETNKLIFSCRFCSIDHNYFPLIEVPILSGSNFTPDSPENQIIVNEHFIEKLKCSDSPIGKNVKFASSKLFTIIGIVKNFKIQANNSTTAPVVFYNQNYWMDNDTATFFAVPHIKLKKMEQSSIEAVQQTINTLYKEKKPEVEIFDETIRQALWAERSYRDTILLVTLFTLVVVLIGLIGYLCDEILRRQKEIAIRKVTGATIKEIITLFFLNFAYVLIPALIAGVSLGYFAANFWLEAYSIKIALSWWIFAFGICFITGIVYLAIWILIRKLASNNPAIR